MRVKVNFTWRQAAAGRFNSDKIRRECEPYKEKRLKGFISKNVEADVSQVKQWLHDNEIKIKNLIGVFTVSKKDATCFYDGIALEFNNDDDMMLFTLRFS